MATTPNYGGTPYIGMVQVATANTNRDGTTGTYGSISVGSAGSRVEEVVVSAIGTTTAGMVRLFLSDGTNTRFLAEMVVSAITPSGTVKAWTARMLFDNLCIPAGWTIKVNTNNAETFNVFAFGGSF